jgi:hypothetical protein
VFLQNTDSTAGGVHSAAVIVVVVLDVDVVTPPVMRLPGFFDPGDLIPGYYESGNSHHRTS